MRYLAGFIGGLVVAILLLVFQQHLIGGEPPLSSAEPPVIRLASVPTSRPPEQKPYEPKTAPPRPEPVDRPVTRTAPAPTAQPLPVRLELPPIGVDSRHGTATTIDFRGPRAFDRGAVVTTAVEPQYPPAALRNRIEGEVEVEFTVRPDGSVGDVQVVRAEPRGVFEQNAVRAIMRWRFVPKHENGRAVPMRARQVIRFALPGG